jgi:hypothetical protein
LIGEYWGQVMKGMDFSAEDRFDFARYNRLGIGSVFGLDFNRRAMRDRDITNTYASRR